MLALTEQSLRAIHAAKDDRDIAEVLASVSHAVGYRSGFLIEYSPDLLTAVHVIDSNADRVGWWSKLMVSSPDRTAESVRALLAQGTVIRLDASHYRNPHALALAKRMDMLDRIIIPITFDSSPIGVGGFVGAASLTPQQESALQLLTYSMFAQVRGFRTVGITLAPEPLTPRETEVIALSADGMTSQEIADQLGVAARTVNQHVDNVARKLGTKNRAHTVAEAIRRKLL